MQMGVQRAKSPSPMARRDVPPTKSECPICGGEGSCLGSRNGRVGVFALL